MLNLFLEEAATDNAEQTIIKVVSDQSIPVWLTIVLALVSGIVATVVTLIVQHYLEKKKVKKNLFLELVALRDCHFDDSAVKLAINKVQIVFYEHSEVIEAYNALISDISNKTLSPTQTVVIDGYIRLLEKIAAVTGYNDFNWDKIKKRVVATDLYNEEIGQADVNSNESQGVAGKKNKSSAGRSSPEKCEGDK